MNKKPHAFSAGVYMWPRC